jgi:hypothetical protein
LFKGPKRVGVFSPHYYYYYYYYLFCEAIGTAATPGLLCQPRVIMKMSPPYLRTETDPVSETSCFLVPRIPDDGKSPNPSNSECDTPSSKPFRIYVRKICSCETLVHSTGIHGVTSRKMVLFEYIFNDKRIFLNYIRGKHEF